MTLCLIGLGSNLGDRASLLQQAGEKLAALPGTRVVAHSGSHATAPVGGPAGQGEFLNAAALLETTLPPLELLAALQRIEAALGRSRGERWGARSIDLDLLLYGDLQMQTPNLTIPHPRMAFRRFMMAPAVEIAANMRHSQLGWTITRLWNHLSSAANYVALAGGSAATRKEIAERTAQLAPASAILLSDIVAGQGSQVWRDLFPSTTSLQSPAAAISDFWLEELAARNFALPDEAVKCIPAPKLLVRLAGESDDASQIIPFDGPQLRLLSEDVPLAVAEVTAAMQAMR